MAASDGTSGGIGSMRSVQTASTTARPASAVKTTSRPTSAAAAPTTGPSSAPNTAAPMAVPITSPRRSPGVAASSHAKAPAHVKPLPDSLQEARAGERPEAVGEGEAEAREPHQRQADEDGSPGAESRGRGSARQSADERAGRVGGDEHACPRLREVEIRARSGGGAA